MDTEPFAETQLAVVARDGGERVCLSVTGELDLSNAECLCSAVAGVLRERAPRQIDVDLAGVSLMDCSGVRALLLCRQAASLGHCRMRVVRPRPMVHRVLKITGLLGLLELSETAPLP